MLHGSGFLAVFVAGLLVGDERFPYKGEIERFHTSLASLAEIVVFFALGLTIHISSFRLADVWLDGLVLAVLLAFVARPRHRRAAAAAGAAAARRAAVRDVGRAEGRGADPARDADRALARRRGASACTGSCSSSSAFSVVVQGGSIPWAARRLGVPMRLVEPEPWNISIGLRAEPHGLQRFVVAAGSRAEGEEIRELPIGDHAWVSLVIRDGAARQARGSLVLEPATRC